MPKDKLAKIRQKIDLADKNIIDALASRFSLLKEIATFKDINKIYDSKREKQILKNVKQKAIDNDLDPKFIKNLYLEILKESKQHLKNILQK
ncbi:MAG: chorismate mutase [Patescibacteria group bacterium]|jgi:chorismate mutase